MSKHTDTPPTRARLRGMLLIEAMYPRLAPDIMDSYKERSLSDRLRTAAIVAHFSLIGGPLRLPLDLSILDAVNVVVKRGRA